MLCQKRSGMRFRAWWTSYHSTLSKNSLPPQQLDPTRRTSMLPCGRTLCLHLRLQAPQPQQASNQQLLTQLTSQPTGFYNGFQPGLQQQPTGFPGQQNLQSQPTGYPTNPQATGYNGPRPPMPPDANERLPDWHVSAADGTNTITANRPYQASGALSMRLQADCQTSMLSDNS